MPIIRPLIEGSNEIKAAEAKHHAVPSPDSKQAEGIQPDSP